MCGNARIHDNAEEAANNNNGSDYSCSSDFTLMLVAWMMIRQTPRIIIIIVVIMIVASDVSADGVDDDAANAENTSVKTTRSQCRGGGGCVSLRLGPFVVVAMVIMTMGTTTKK
jgi:hypothetical protein